MQNDVTIKRVPLIRSDLKCPVCGKSLTHSTNRYIELHTKDYKTTYVKCLSLLYCPDCCLPFASPQMFTETRLRNNGFCMEGFMITRKDRIPSILNEMQQPAYMQRKNRVIARKRAQKREKQNELKAQIEEKRREHLQAVSSAAVMICVQFSDGDMRDFIIVKCQEAAAKAENILHYLETDALELLTAAFAWQRVKCGVYHGKKYSVVETISASTENRFFMSPADIDILLLRGQRVRDTAEDNTLHSIDILLYSPFIDRLEPQRVLFSERYRSVYMDAQQFMDFAKCFGNPKITFDFDEVPSDETPSERYDDLRKESVLKAFGYNVSAKDGLPAKLRQELLADLMDLGILSREQIVNYLDFFINGHKSISYADARWKWHEDLDFTRNYIENPERFLILNDRMLTSDRQLARDVKANYGYDQQGQ